jgi:hypothetical protein
MTLSGTSTGVTSVAMSTRVQERYPSATRADQEMLRGCQRDQERSMKKDQQQKPAKNVDDYLAAAPEEVRLVLETLRV